MALFSRKNLKHGERKWLTVDDILSLLEDVSRRATGPFTVYTFIVDNGVVKDIEDLYREPVHLEFRNITFYAQRETLLEDITL